MSNTIILKRKTTTGAPQLTDLQIGEGCIVVPDSMLYYKKDASTLLAFPSNFKTINNQSIVGEGNLNIGGTTITTGTAAPSGGSDGDVYLQYQ